MDESAVYKDNLAKSTYAIRDESCIATTISCQEKTRVAFSFSFYHPVKRLKQWFLLFLLLF